MSKTVPSGRVRHVLGISGGKDSAALAIYMRERVPDMEYFFCDTGAELPETYEYLDRLEACLGKPIARLNSGRSFEHWLAVYRGTLPSPQMRWCTKVMKIKPFEEWIGHDEAITYIGIRADEDREGYISGRSTIRAVFPFKEDGVTIEGVQRILDDAGVGLPAYYEWRTRSGCFFCFFQRKAEWVGLQDRHPELFDQAVAYEAKASYEAHAMEGRSYTWSGEETLPELARRRDEILERHARAVDRASASKANRPLIDVLGVALDADDDSTGCSVCHV